MPRSYAIKVELDPTPEQVAYMQQCCDWRRILWRQTCVWDQNVVGACPWQPGTGKVRAGQVCKPARPLRDGIPTALLYAVEQSYRQAWQRAKNEGAGPPSVHDEETSFAYQVTVLDTDGLRLPKFAGRVRHKEDPRARLGAGKVERATVSRDVDRWYVSYTITNGDSLPATPGHDWVGIDAKSGATVGYVLSDGTRYPLPPGLIAAEAAREAAQRRCSQHLERARRAAVRDGHAGASQRKWRPKSARHQALRDAVALAYRRERRIRANWLHNVTTAVVTRYRYIAIEDLRVKSMTRSAAGTMERPGKNVAAKSGLNRSILRASFAEFRRQLEYKAAWRGCTVVAVDPAYTSRDCNRCGTRNDAAQEYRAFVCESCGHRDDRDDNAAKNIEFRGRLMNQAAAETPAGSGCMDVEPAMVPATKRQRPRPSRARAGQPALARKIGDRPRPTVRASARPADEFADGHSTA